MGVGATLPATASAWRHLQVLWDAEGPPVQIRVADDGRPHSAATCEASGGLSSCCDAGVPGGFCHQAAAESVARWLDPICTSLTVDVLDGTQNADLVAANQAPDLSDEVNAITFDDPAGELVETGVLAATYGASGFGPFAEARDGVLYFRPRGSVDIVFNTSVPFLTNEQLTTEACTDAFSFEEVMSHEMGHFLGLAHSCERFDVCPDALRRQATMYYASLPCTSRSTQPNTDDLEGIQALYGPSASIDCTPTAGDQVFGSAPLTMECVLDTRGMTLSEPPRWRFGDGARAEGTTVSHTYTRSGTYDVEVELLADTDTCGQEFPQALVRPAFVRVCDLPDASFEVARGLGQQVQLLNHSDLSEFGCVGAVQWEVFSGEDIDGAPIVGPLHAWEPIIELPTPGQYTAVLHVGGPSGTASARATFDTDGRAGCQHAPAAPLAGLLLVSGLVLRRSRRVALGGRSGSP